MPAVWPSAAYFSQFRRSCKRLRQADRTHVALKALPDKDKRKKEMRLAGIRRLGIMLAGGSLYRARATARSSARCVPRQESRESKDSPRECAPAPTPPPLMVIAG